MDLIGAASLAFPVATVNYQKSLRKPTLDIPRVFTIRESSHRIHNPLTAEKLATLGRALRLPPGARVLDLACGSGELLRRSLAPGGLMPIGEPYWRREPPDQATVEGCFGKSEYDWLPLPGLIERFGEIGCDVVELVLADQDSWDRYVAPQWLNIRRWLAENPGDELAGELGEELRTAAWRHVTYQREYLGWGVFALMDR
jgi:hypothetical protein